MSLKTKAVKLARKIVWRPPAAAAAVAIKEVKASQGQSRPITGSLPRAATVRRVIGGVRHGIGLLLFTALLFSGEAWGQPSFPPTKTTLFTRGLIGTNADAPSFVSALGFLSTNMTTITNYTGNGASVTNLNASELRSGTVPLPRLVGITTTEILDGTITTADLGAGVILPTATTAIGLTNGLRELLAPRLSGGVGRGIGSYSENGFNSDGVLIGGAGAEGVIRDIWCMPDLGGGSSWEHMKTAVWFQVYVGGGNSVDPDSSLRTINIPLGELYSDKFRFSSNGHYEVLRRSMQLDTVESSTNFYIGYGVKTFRWKFDMPFTNGAFIRLYSTSSNANWQLGYFGANYELGAAQANAGYKLKHLRYSDTTGTGSNFLFAATGPGLAAGFCQGWHDADFNNTVAFLDSKGPTFWTGTTKWDTVGDGDMYGNTLSGSATRQHIGQDAGTMLWDIGAAEQLTGYLSMECYRWLDSDAFSWTNGVTVYVPNSNPIQSMYFNLFYYAP